jgi:hypothetical protein
VGLLATSRLSGHFDAGCQWQEPDQQRDGLKNLVSALCGLFLSDRSTFCELT